MKYIKNKFNKYIKIENLLLSRVCDVHPCCVFMDVCFVPFLFCLFTCVCVGSTFKVHCGSAFEPGASGLPYHCTGTPPVCVPAVLGTLAVWQYNKKKKNYLLQECGYISWVMVRLWGWCGLGTWRGSEMELAKECGHQCFGPFVFRGCFRAFRACVVSRIQVSGLCGKHMILFCQH